MAPKVERLGAGASNPPPPSWPLRWILIGHGAQNSFLSLWRMGSNLDNDPSICTCWKFGAQSSYNCKYRDRSVMPVSLLWFGEKMNLSSSDSMAHALELQTLGGVGESGVQASCPGQLQPCSPFKAIPGYLRPLSAEVLEYSLRWGSRAMQGTGLPWLLLSQILCSP